MSAKQNKNYAELFSTPLGKEVLEDMQKIWKEDAAQLDHGALSFIAGRRSVIREIESYIAKGLKGS